VMMYNYLFVDVLLWMQSYASVFARVMSQIKQYQNKAFLELG